MRASQSSRVTVATTVALGVAAALAWYFLRREPTESTASKLTAAASEKKKKIDVSNATQAEVLQILEAVASSQEVMKQVMKSLSEDLYKDLKSGKSSLTFEEVYDKVAAAVPPDPLESAGIQMNEFDRMLDKYSTDTEVRWAIDRIMGGTSPPDPAENSSSELSLEKIIEIHKYMLQQLKDVVNQVKNSPGGKAADLRAATVTAQVIVSAKVMDKFGITSEAVEHAVYVQQYALSVSEEFTQCTMEIQSAMSELVVSNYPFVA